MTIERDGKFLRFWRQLNGLQSDLGLPEIPCGRAWRMFVDAYDYTAFDREYAANVRRLYDFGTGIGILRKLDSETTEEHFGKWAATSWAI